MSNTHPARAANNTLLRINCELIAHLSHVKWEYSLAVLRESKTEHMQSSAAAAAAAFPRNLWETWHNYWSIPSPVNWWAMEPRGKKRKKKRKRLSINNLRKLRSEEKCLKFKGWWPCLGRKMRCIHRYTSFEDICHGRNWIRCNDELWREWNHCILKKTCAHCYEIASQGSHPDLCVQIDTQSSFLH